MKKYLILAAFAAVALGACTKVETVKETVDEPLTFGVYTGKAATKAVSDTDFGTITTASLQEGTSNGFGVFAFYTNDGDYNATSSLPNFMYNQKVTYSGSAWTYSPLKYWPNEHGTSATSTGIDKLTFLAYAPWVDILSLGTTSVSTIKDGAATPAAATEGITEITGNNTAGSTLLTFVVPASSEEQIDLLYGTLGAKSVNVDGTPEGTVGGAIENLTKEKTGGKVNILFKHSLAKIVIDIKDVIDQEDPTSTATTGPTKVVVNSVKLLGADLATSGKLNLYTGSWSNTNAVTNFIVSPLPASIYVDAAPTVYADIPAGVVQTGLDANKLNLMLIPGASSKITGVEIVYYVCTEDANLNGGMSVVENHITKTLPTASQLSVEQGKQYSLNILLGLTSVKLDATVDPWTVVTGSTDVDLPQNVS